MSMTWIDFGQVNDTITVDAAHSHCGSARSISVRRRDRCGELLNLTMKMIITKRVGLTNWLMITSNNVLELHLQRWFVRQSFHFPPIRRCANFKFRLFTKNIQNMTFSMLLVVTKADTSFYNFGNGKEFQHWFCLDEKWILKLYTNWKKMHLLFCSPHSKVCVCVCLSVSITRLLHFHFFVFFVTMSNLWAENSAEPDSLLDFQLRSFESDQHACRLGHL